MTRICSVLLALLLVTPAAFAEKLKPSKTHAVLNVSVTNFQGAPLPDEQIVFKDTENKSTFTGTSDGGGHFALLLPKGRSYEILFQSLSGPYKVDDMSVPANAGVGSWSVQFDNTTYELRNVLFDVGKASLQSSSYAELNRLVKGLKQYPEKVIEIAGHTDSDGDDDYNMKLSQDRANTVRDYLISKGIAADRVTAVGYGESQPVADNSTAAGKAQNRRTEVRMKN